MFPSQHKIRHLRIPGRSSEINDKYFLLDYANINFQCEMFLSHARYFHQIGATFITKGVKNSLRKHVQFWKHIGANQSVIDIINKDYDIPLRICRRSFKGFIRYRLYY